MSGKGRCRAVQTALPFTPKIKQEVFIKQEPLPLPCLHSRGNGPDTARTSSEASYGSGSDVAHTPSAAPRVNVIPWRPAVPALALPGVDPLSDSSGCSGRSRGRPSAGATTESKQKHNDFTRNLKMTDDDLKTAWKEHFSKLPQKSVDRQEFVTSMQNQMDGYFTGAVWTEFKEKSIIGKMVS